MSYAAAAEGQGVAVGQRFLAQQDLAAGRLVMGFRKTVDMGDFTHYLLVRGHREKACTQPSSAGLTRPARPQADVRRPRRTS